MKRILLTAILLFTVSAIIVPGAFASSTYYIYNQWGGTWHDVNKTYVDDSLMCWAASAANILDWGNWDTASYNTETSIFANIKAHWTNNHGWQSWAWNWWLNGTPPPNKIYAHIDVAGGGDYYPAADFYSYYSAASGAGEMSAMDKLMHQGYGISLAIYKGSASHAVTVWGFDSTLVNGQTNYNALYITDSDDGTTALKKMGIAYNTTSGWYFTSGYSGWTINGVYGLEMYGGPLTQMSQAFLPNSASAPIASTWLLLGSGLAFLSMAGWRPRTET